MDFDKSKVYGDTFISDGLVVFYVSKEHFILIVEIFIFEAAQMNLIVMVVNNMAYVASVKM